MTSLAIQANNPGAQAQHLAAISCSIGVQAQSVSVETCAVVAIVISRSILNDYGLLIMLCS